jgi:cellulose synthase/poly-beta-1,6-N-acetylglucosamine synthase-like glycosyltransferase
MRKLLFWPLTFGLMALLVSNEGGTTQEILTATVTGILIGLVFALALGRIVRKPKTRLVADLVLALGWALVLFMIGYPSLYIPDKGTDPWSILFLVALSLIPFLFLCIGAIFTFFMNQRRNSSGPAR